MAHHAVHAMPLRLYAEGLIDAVDGFCEGIAFSVDEMARVFDHAAGLGLPVKLHAEQLSDLGGAAMAARRGAIWWKRRIPLARTTRAWCVG